jgi:hypothetical protein
MVEMFPTKVGPTVGPTIGPSVGTNNPWVDGFTFEPMSKAHSPFPCRRPFRAEACLYLCLVL